MGWVTLPGKYAPPKRKRKSLPTLSIFRCKLAVSFREGRRLNGVTPTFPKWALSGWVDGIWTTLWWRFLHGLRQYTTSAVTEKHKDPEWFSPMQYPHKTWTKTQPENWTEIDSALRILKPSNGGVWTCIAGVYRSLKPPFLRGQDS